MVTPILFDLLGEGFFLEISSPGVNRPLVKVEDYKKYSGSKISVVFAEMNEKKNVKCVGKLHFEGDNSENGYNIFITDIESKEKTETEYKIDLENVVHCELFVDKNEFTKEFTKSKKEQR
jgi:ribosome maturation factor RimP